MDDDGNRTSVVSTPYGVSPATESYTTNTLNQYTAVGGTSQTYDGNGTVAAATTLSYKCNYKNLVSEIRATSTNALIAAYRYDADGRRVEKSVSGAVSERYIYTAFETAEIYDGSQAWKRDLVYDVSGIDRPIVVEQPDVLDQDSDGNTSDVTRSYYHANAMGSIVQITTSGETEAVSYRYGPYGELTISRDGTTQAFDPLGQHSGFTGRFHDEETGLIYCRARYLDPATGRFVHRDPAGYDEGSCLYSYCASSPTVYRDPSGMFKAPDHQKLTEQAAKGLGLSADCIRRLVMANTGQDAKPETDISGKNGGDHFTTPPTLDDLIAELERKKKEAEEKNGSDVTCGRYTSSGIGNLAEALGFTRKNPCANLMDLLGKLLHNIQDFYAHTNYVQFWEPGKAPVWDGSKAQLPLGNRTTMRGGSNGTGGQAFHVVAYGGLFNSASADHNENSFDEEKSPEHENAMDAAGRATTALLRQLLNQKPSLLERCCVDPNAPGK